MEEKWVDISGYEGLYQVSNFGRIKSLVGWNGCRYVIREKILLNSKTTTGYWKIELSKNKKKKSLKVHRLIAQAFIPNNEHKPNINHKDGNPLNNNVENLEWCTQKENVNHAIQTGLKKVMIIPQNEIKDLYLTQKYSLQKIANLYEANAVTIQCRLEKCGIKRRSKSESKIVFGLTKEFILSELETKSQKQVAKETGCNSSLISHYLKRIKERGNIYG